MVVVRGMYHKDMASPAKMLMRAATLSRTGPIGTLDIATWIKCMDAGIDALGCNFFSLVCVARTSRLIGRRAGILLLGQSHPQRQWTTDTNGSRFEHVRSPLGPEMVVSLHWEKLVPSGGVHVGPSEALEGRAMFSFLCRSAGDACFAAE